MIYHWFKERKCDTKIYFYTKLFRDADFVLGNENDFTDLI